MAKDSIDIGFVQGQAVTERRGIAWLRDGRNALINAETVFNALPAKDKLFLHASMNAWLDGKPDIKTRFHGFPGEHENKDCYVFKWRDDRVQQRIYGFKAHPGIPNAGFQVCILAMHTTKDTAETDPWYKKAMNRLRDDKDVQDAILKQVKVLFPIKPNQPLLKVRK